MRTIKKLFPVIAALLLSTSSVLATGSHDAFDPVLNKERMNHVGTPENLNSFSLDILRKFYLTPHHMLTKEFLEKELYPHVRRTKKAD